MRSTIRAVGMLMAFVAGSQASAAELAVWTVRASLPNARSDQPCPRARAQSHRHRGRQLRACQKAHERRAGGRKPGWVRKTWTRWAKASSLQGRRNPDNGRSRRRVRTGTPKPDISTVEAYDRTPGGEIHRLFVRMQRDEHRQGIEELGLTEQLKAKTVRTGSQAGGGLLWRIW